MAFANPGWGFTVLFAIEPRETCDFAQQHSRRGVRDILGHVEIDLQIFRADGDCLHLSSSQEIRSHNPNLRTEVSDQAIDLKKRRGSRGQIRPSYPASV